jgi:hypothetical protein
LGLSSPQSKVRVAILVCTFALMQLSGGKAQDAYAREGEGCEGVEFAKRAPVLYSPSALRDRLERDPADVDALVHLGLHLEEKGEPRQALDLYLRAVRAKPACSLGYYFAGLVEETISDRLGSDCVKEINKAISLDPSLREDPNIEAFLRRHSPRAPVPSPTPAGPAANVRALLAGGGRFMIGVGVGLLLAVCFSYLFGRRRRVRS